MGDLLIQNQFDHTVRLNELSSSLDWLKQIRGVDDDYLAQWDLAQWTQWHRAMACLTMTPNPCVPHWLGRIIGNNWSKDWSLPWPSVGQLWPTAHDWFSEDQSHDDFQLKIAPAGRYSHKSAPELQQLRQAWRFAAEHHDVVPLLMMDLRPPGPMDQAITGQITAFIVIAKQFQPMVAQDLMQILSQPSEPTNLFVQEELRAVSGQDSDHDLTVLYELNWMS